MQEGHESFFARSQVLNACKAVGIQAIDSVFSDVGDMEALRLNALRSKAMGFDGMGCTLHYNDGRRGIPIGRTQWRSSDTTPRTMT